MSLTGSASRPNELQGSVESGGEVRGKLSGLEFIQGKSAYEVAVINGFSGTEKEWLASLKGKDGKSAYDGAVAYGYKGTEEQFYAILALLDERAQEAVTAEQNAKASAASAASSASSASQSAQAAAESEKSANAAKEGLQTAEQNAANSASAALSAKTAAESASASAASSATNASKSEQNAANSESNAASSKQSAATSAQNAATSEANAKTSEGNAKTSETNAKASENAAKTSETNAANSSTSAQAAQKAAEQARNEAQAIAGGDFMERTTYDPQGKKTDIFKYVDDAVSNIPAPDLTKCVTAATEIPDADEMTEGEMRMAFLDAPRLPEGFTEVEYIESNGKQRINTGWKPASTNVKVVAKAQVLEVKADEAYVFGATSWSYPRAYSPVISIANGRVSARCGGTSMYAFATVGTDDAHVFEVELKDGMVRASVDETKDERAFTGSLATQPMFLFAENYEGTAARFTSSLRMEYTQVYENGALVRDYVPCIDSNGVAGMYELVNGVFNGSEGAEPFIAGPVVEFAVQEPSIGLFLKEGGKRKSIFVSDSIDPNKLTEPVPIHKGGTGAASAADALTNLGALPKANPSSTGVFTHDGKGAGNTDVILKLRSNNGMLTGYGDVSSAFHFGGVPVYFDTLVFFGNGFSFPTPGGTLTGNFTQLKGFSNSEFRSGTTNYVETGCNYGAYPTAEKQNFIVKNIDPAGGTGDNWSYQAFNQAADGTWERVFGVKADGTIVSKGVDVVGLIGDVNSLLDEINGEVV